MEIDGRSLPPGEHLGARLLALRLRTKTSRASLAEISGISRTTIAAIEAGQPGHLAALERLGEALGARLTLVRRGQPAAFYASVGTSSAWDAWASPQEVLDRLYAALGEGFDLDPCSPGRGRCRVRARRHLTEDDDGLSVPWHGRAFMNPPYGRHIAAWTAKARGEVEAGRCTLVIGLIPARTDTTWWHQDVADRGDIWLLKGRLSFGAGDQSAPFPSAIVAWGLKECDRLAMRAAFPEAWHLAPAPPPRTV
jgi:transcriptional regulator with XRE-family HTH domain